MTPFALAMNAEFKVDDAVESYRNYYRVKKEILQNGNIQINLLGLFKKTEIKLPFFFIFLDIYNKKRKNESKNQVRSSF